MNIVVDVITEYLRSNRRLIVPAFGAFVVKESGERIFSDLLRNDDGQLASLLRARGLSEMEAAVMIDRFIFEVRHELEQYGYCRLGEVGTLRIEPATKVWRLYPPVQGEMPKQTPYIPKPIVEMREEPKAEQKAEQKAEPKAEQKAEPKEEQHRTEEVEATKVARPKAKPRKRFDVVMVAAVVILVAALAAIAYGWYVSGLSEADDDARMDAMRVTPTTVNE